MSFWVKGKVDDQYFEGKAKGNTNVLTSKRIRAGFCVLLLN